VTEGTGHVIDPAGDARRTLQDAVTSHGPEVLSDPTVMDHLCRTQLAALPGESILIVSAARADVPALLRDAIPQFGNYGAIQSVATTLAQASDLDGAASLWVVREFARALGLIAPGGTQSMPRPAPDGTGAEVPGATVATGVLEPELDVRRWVEHLALDDEGVAAVDEPAGHPLVPRVAFDDRPVRHDVAPTAVGEVRRSPAHDRLDDLVARQAGVAVDEALARPRGGRRDHERRVGRDQVEGLAGHRFPEGALAHLHVDVVERGVERGDRQGARIDVGRDDPAGVRGQVERLDPAAGAEVECAVDRPPGGQLGERGGGRAHAQDMVGRHPDRLAVETGCQVADHPPVAGVVGVRPAVQDRAGLATRRLDQAAPDRPGERSDGGPLVDRGLQEEEPHQGRQRRSVRRTPQGRGRLVALQRRPGGVTEQAVDGVHGVVGGPERIPEGGCAARVGDAGHDRGTG